MNVEDKPIQLDDETEVGSQLSLGECDELVSSGDMMRDHTVYAVYEVDLKHVVLDAIDQCSMIGDRQSAC